MLCNFPNLVVLGNEIIMKIFSFPILFNTFLFVFLDYTSSDTLGIHLKIFKTPINVNGTKVMNKKTLNSADVPLLFYLDYLVPKVDSWSIYTVD